MATAADIIPNAGRAHVAGLLSNTVAEPANYYGNVGTGATTAAVADTTLDTEVATARIITANSVVTTTIASDTAQKTFTYTAAGSFSIQNAGVFTALTVGTMVQKSSFATIPLLSGDSIAFTFKTQVV